MEISPLLPRHFVMENFLPENEAQSLLEWAIASEERFRPATVSKARPHIDANRRVAYTTSNLGRLREQLHSRLSDILVEAMEATGTRGPQPKHLEIELAAHGDGAFYGPHLDLPAKLDPAAAPLPDGDRILSAVYYFHSRPRKFTGGQLRIFRMGPVPGHAEPQTAAHFDIEPTHNTLVAFPSWVPHEVRPVSVPSNEFRHFRFALNCWYCRPFAD